MAALRSETLCAWTTKDKYPKSVTPRTSHITINAVAPHLVLHQLDNQGHENIAETLTVAAHACMLYKPTSASFHITTGCVVTVVKEGTKMDKLTRACEAIYLIYTIQMIGD